MGKGDGKFVWIAARGWMNLQLECATTLKGLCELTGANYNTAKTREGDQFKMSVGAGVTEVAWEFRRVEVKKVAGRGKS